MVWNFVQNLLGIGASAAASSAQAYVQSRAGMELQHAYNKELAKDSYEYTKQLAKDSYGYNWRLNRESYGYSSALMSQQYALERESRQNSFVDTRKDLEAAGYNPLLALGQQSGYVNVGASHSPSSFTMPDSNAVSSAVGAYNDTRRANSEIDSSKYSNELNMAMTEKVRSEATGQDINNRIQDAHGEQRAIQEIENLKKDGLLKDKEANFYEHRIANLRSQTALNSAMANNYRSQTELQALQMAREKGYSDFAKDHPIVSGALSAIGSPVSAIGAGAGIYALSKKNGGPQFKKNKK